MSSKPGSEMLLKQDVAGNGTFITIGGIQTQQLAIKVAEVDVTNQQSVGKWRELLAGAGIKSASGRGSGTYKNDAPMAQVFANHINNVIRPWQIIIPGLGTLEGPVATTNLEFTGPHEKDMNWDIAFESAGALVFTPE